MHPGYPGGLRGFSGAPMGRPMNAPGYPYGYQIAQTAQTGRRYSKETAGEMVPRTMSYAPVQADSRRSSSDLSRCASASTAASTPTATGSSGVPGLVIQKSIGDGDFSTVFLGSWKGTEVAVKVLDARKKANQRRNLESDVEAEVRALTGLDHPNCLKLLTSGPLTIVTDLASGVPLSDVLYVQRRKLPSPTVFALKLAEVVAHLHTRSPAVVHRDLKPENVMVDLDTLDLKLIDFGMAQCVGVKKLQITFDGSPLYAAPEALNGAPPSTASEVWSLACVLVEMWGPGRPYGTQNVRGMADLRAKLQSGMPPWRALPHLPRPDVVNRAFTLTPSRRPSASEIAQAMGSKAA